MFNPGILVYPGIPQGHGGQWWSTEKILFMDNNQGSAKIDKFEIRDCNEDPLTK